MLHNSSLESLAMDKHSSLLSLLFQYIRGVFTILIFFLTCEWPNKLDCCVILGWKDLQGTNTQADCANPWNKLGGGIHYVSLHSLQMAKLERCMTLDWKVLLRTNTLAYRANYSINSGSYSHYFIFFLYFVALVSNQICRDMIDIILILAVQLY